MSPSLCFTQKLNCFANAVQLKPLHSLLDADGPVSVLVGHLDEEVDLIV